MKDARIGWQAAAAALLAFGAAACGSDTTHGGAMGGNAGSIAKGNGGSGGAGGASQSAGGTSSGGAAQGGTAQNAGGDDGAGAAGGDLGVAGPGVDCTFELMTSGAQVISYAPALLGCTTVGAQLYALFVNLDGWQTEFMASGLNEGETGVPLPASFMLGNQILHAGWRIEDGGCTVTVTEQVLLGPAPYAATAGPGRQYRITGHGDCSTPAKDTQGMAPDIITGPFSFRARKSYRD